MTCSMQIEAESRALEEMIIVNLPDEECGPTRGTPQWCYEMLIMKLALTVPDPSDIMHITPNVRQACLRRRWRVVGDLEDRRALCRSGAECAGESHGDWWW